MLNRIFILVLILFGASACATSNETASVDKLPVSFAVQGTKTALVGIGVDKKGYPVETVKQVVLTPGQRVVLAGPDDFQIVFKEKKSPTSDIRYASDKGVVIINVPKDILRKPEYKDELARNGYIQFNYAIRIKGKELDPILIVKKDD